MYQTHYSVGWHVNLLTASRVSPLHEACLGGHSLCANFLVRHGADVNAVNMDWQTPLFNACVRGNVTCVNLLLEHGARPTTEYDLVSPIHEAAKRGFTDCLESLSRYGADIDYEVEHTGTPLYTACAHQQVDCARKLLDLGASVNHGKSLDSPLHEAARNSNCKLIQLLLDYGAAVMSQNAEGKQPADLVCLNSTAATVLLKNKGPFSLLQLCRLCIRKYLGSKRLHLIATLHIPRELKQYLLYQLCLPPLRPSSNTGTLGLQECKT
ncbi:ankyrin repeat and SOCS box protein 9-like isoform X2 [Protopterus annectens]|uniref:ankyrin repeat and SOCS box protein 9-like isoform X2 n=1 Tax=Protopterus annectens TaxID=7888 RepID=UPI001CFB62A4|nr:ankyrin repeat and SOCS box protein 9-like isoform X2 [Protopterus annectens]